MMEAHKEVVRANKLESCYLRPIAYYGSEKMGVSPIGAKVHVAIAAWPWGAYLGEEGLKRGIRVKTSSFARHHVNVTMARAKLSGTYTNSILANREATMHGYDEALLLDVDGFVAEGAGENVFIVKDGVIYEPEIASALMGITRASVIAIAKDLGLSVVSKRLTRDDIYIADETFFSGTAAEVTPVRELDGRTIGIGSRGPITGKIQSAFFDIVNGRNKKYAKWLTPIAAAKGAKAAAKKAVKKAKPAAKKAKSNRFCNPSGRSALRSCRAVRSTTMSTTQEMPVVELEARDLPAFCPNKSMPLWSQHPRVFLDIATEGSNT